MFNAVLSSPVRRLAILVVVLVGTLSMSFVLPRSEVAREAANDIIAALKRRDMAAVAQWAHPFRGVTIVGPAENTMVSRSRISVVVVDP